MGRAPQGVCDAQAGYASNRTRTHQLLPWPSCPFQMSGGGGVHHAPEDLHRQDPEIPAAPEGVAGARECYLRSCPFLPCVCTPQGTIRAVVGDRYAPVAERLHRQTADHLDKRIADVAAPLPY